MDAGADADALLAFPELTPPEQPVAVARVLVDVDLPNLDRPLDYEVPADLDSEVRPGRQVKVKLAGRTVKGWVVDRATTTEQLGKLQPVLKVVSQAVEAPPQLLELARYLADRHASTAAQVLSLAIPTRHARAEKAVLADEQGAAGAGPDLTDAQRETWANQPLGTEFLQHLAGGGAPRIVWQMLPATWRHQLAAAIAACRSAGRSALVIVPTVADAEDLAADLREETGQDVAVDTGEASAEDRYRLHLEVQRGLVPVVVGTRSAQWLPMRDLGLVVVLDDGDDNLAEVRAPRVTALDVLVARSHLEGTALIAGSYSRSVKAQFLADTGWAVSMEPPREVVRAQTPRVDVPDEFDKERDGPSAASRLPHSALQLIRAGLEEGPVLVQVPLGGYVPVVACARCGELARCPQCGGPESLQSDGSIACAWCGRGTAEWRCPQCSGTKLRSVRVGSERTAEELGRNVPGVRLTQSSAARGVVRTVDSEPRLVVATPGAEPVAQDGYSAVVVLDADATASRPELWAPEESLRRWFNALALSRPRRPALVVGLSDRVLAQTLVRWDPVDFARRQVDERAALGFFPVKTVVALDGDTAEVQTVVDQLGADVLGMVPRGGEGESRALVRAPREEAGEMLADLRRIQQARAARRAPLVRTTVNPPELF